MTREPWLGMVLATGQRMGGKETGTGGSGGVVRQVQGQAKPSPQILPRKCYTPEATTPADRSEFDGSSLC